MKWLKSPFVKRFRNNKAALFSFFIFTLIIIVSVGASIVANDRPIVMGYQGKVYWPVAQDYLPAEFGLTGFVTDYFAIEDHIRKDGWMVYPPIKQRPFEQNLNFDELPAPPGSCSRIAEDEGGGFEVCHAIGTDTGGRDLLTRLIYACRTSLLMATAITALSLLLGVILGALMGYMGGKFDILVGRLLETVGYFPVIFLLIILVAFLEEPSVSMIVLIFSVLGLSPFAFYMRGQVLKVRKLTYIEAAQAIGQTNWNIVFSHILPNALGPIVVLVPFTITNNITALATVDFLGFGVQPPTASLGSILRSGYENMSDRWWLVVSAATILVLILMLVNFIGEGVRSGLDPKAIITKKKIAELEKNEEERQRQLHLANQGGTA